MKSKSSTTTKPKFPPVHPGEILLEECMKPLGLTANRLALELRVPATRIHDIVKGKRAVTAETALRLGRYFRTGPEFWLNPQSRYDLPVPAEGLQSPPPPSSGGCGSTAS
jgi:antitoxin HigA-1